MLSRVKKERKAQIEKITREVFPSLKPYRFRLGKAYFFAKIFVPYLTTAYGQPDKSLISCGFTRLDLFTSTCFCLSWCVHPTDAYAQEYENGQLGKTEMWYVLDASKDAKLVYGLKRERTEQQMRDAIAKGTLMKDLQWVPVKKDDLFFIEAGTIHAIGAGALVAEIQENSNLTYRLYDYDRVGKDGKKRELHIDKALDVANLKGSAEPKQPLRVLKYRQGVASELLTRCKYAVRISLALNPMGSIQQIEPIRRSTAVYTVVTAKVNGTLTEIARDKTKTKSSCRTLPLIPACEQMLNKMKKEQEQNRKVCGKSYCTDYLDYIYVDPMGKRIRPDFLSQHFPDFLVAHQMKRIRFHDLRHPYVKPTTKKFITFFEVFRAAS